ncbi:helix-turn-helix transcriptional regulator, partial [Listeria monocytogenes]|nr:helix-turn-helix transcriptional regulator [Listeria monocytogenes]
MIGRRIKELRMEKKLSISQLAEQSEITKSYLSNIERDICTNPTIDVIQKLARGLKVHPSVLLGWEEDKKKLESKNDSLTCIEDIITSMNNEQLKELKDYVDIIEWKRRK